MTLLESKVWNEKIPCNSLWTKNFINNVKKRLFFFNNCCNYTGSIDMYMCLKARSTWRVAGLRLFLCYLNQKENAKISRA